MSFDELGKSWHAGPLGASSRKYLPPGLQRAEGRVDNGRGGRATSLGEKNVGQRHGEVTC